MANDEAPAAEAAEPTPAAAPSQPIPEAFTEADPAPVEQSELEKSYDVTDPSEVKPVKETEPSEDSAAAEKAGEGEGDEIDPDLLQRAGKFGLAEDEIVEMGSNDALKRYVERLEKFSKPVETAVKQPEKKAEEAAAIPDFKVDLDPKEYDEKIVGALNAMNEHWAKKVQALEATFQSANQFVQQQQQKQNEVLLDGAFSELKDLAQFVGDKPMSQLGDTSEAGKTRIAIVHQARVMASGYVTNNMQVPEIKTLLSQAARVVLGSKLQTIATEKVRQSVATRQGQFIGRGTAVKAGSDARTPEERAREKVAELIKSRGLDD